MDRETCTETLPSGVVIEFKKWITIGEQKEIDAIMMNSVEVKSIEKMKGGEFDSIDISMIEKMEKKGIEIVVTNMTVEEIHNLRSSDYESIKQIVDSVISGKEYKKKENK